MPAHRTTSLSAPRTCDACTMSGYVPARLACWDAPAFPGGRWGYLCREHGSAYGAARLPAATRITYPADVKAAFTRTYRAAARAR